MAIAYVIRWTWPFTPEALGPRERAFLLACGAVTGWATWPALAVYSSPAPPLLILGLGASVGFVMTLLLAQRPSMVLSTLRGEWLAVTVVTAGVVLNNAFYLTAISRIGPAEANVVHYLWPIFLCLIVATVSRRAPGGWSLTGVALAFGGAALAIGPGFSRGIDLVGLCCGLLGAASFAIYSAIRTFSRSGPDVIGPAMGVVALVCLVGHAAFEKPMLPDIPELAAIAAIGIIPLTLSNRLWDLATRTGQIPMISSLAYFNPVVAMLILAVLGVAPVTLETATAAVLIVAGALMASRG